MSKNYIDFILNKIILRIRKIKKIDIRRFFLHISFKFGFHVI